MLINALILHILYMSFKRKDGLEYLCHLFTVSVLCILDTVICESLALNSQLMKFCLSSLRNELHY